MFAKVCLDKQIHLYHGEPSLEALKQHCKKVFRGLGENEIQFVYLDEDNDEICISSQADIHALNAGMTTSHKAIKLFIRERQNQFQVLNSEPEKYECFQDLKIQGNSIRIQTKQQDQIIQQTVNKYLEEVEQSLVNKIMREQEEKIVISEVDKFMMDLAEDISQKIARQEEQELKINSHKKINRSIGTDSIIQKKKQSNNKEIVLINKLVNQKLEEMMPSIIRQVTKTVEHKIAGCEMCALKKKYDSDLQFQQLISSELRYKMKNKMDKNKLYRNKECQF